MQMAFGFWAGEDLDWLRDRLRRRFGRVVPACDRSPIGQLVKSLISGRTRDRVSLGAYRRLVAAYPGWAGMARALPGDLERVIAYVTFPKVKARHLRQALVAIAGQRPDFDLALLGGLEVPRALAWLEGLPGVGRKVSASTLNFSRLRMPAFVVDAPVLRVLRRFGLVRGKADTRGAYDRTMAAVPGWSAAELAELHVLMKLLGQSHCRPERPDCAGCPLGRRCRAAAQDTAIMPAGPFLA